MLTPSCSARVTRRVSRLLGLTHDVKYSAIFKVLLHLMAAQSLMKIWTGIAVEFILIFYAVKSQSCYPSRPLAPSPAPPPPTPSCIASPISASSAVPRTAETCWAGRCLGLRRAGQADECSVVGVVRALGICTGTLIGHDQADPNSEISVQHGRASQGVMHHGAVSCTSPIHSAHAELTNNAKPAILMAHFPPSSLR
jgi:hypothetical protein